MIHEENPRDALFKKIGMTKDLKIPGFTIFGNRVLVGIYEMPEKTKSGIFMPDRVRDENLHQGKAGIILAMGHAAFVSDSAFDFGPDKFEVGDYCLMFVSHGLRCAVNGVSCRVVRDQDLTMKVPSPDAIW